MSTGRRKDKLPTHAQLKAAEAVLRRVRSAYDGGDRTAVGAVKRGGGMAYALDLARRTLEALREGTEDYARLEQGL